MYQQIKQKLEAELKFDFDVKEGRSFRKYTTDLEIMQRKLVKYKHLNKNFEEILRKQKMRYFF
jgi:hypothetical protein